LNRCTWEDGDGVECESRARRKYCSLHQSAAAAQRQREYRERQKNPRRKTDAPDYVPENNTRAAYEEILAKEGRQLAQSGRVIPRPVDVPAKPARREEPEVQDGRVRKQSIYDHERRSSAPAAVRRDRQKFAEWQAQEQGLIADPGDGLDWAAIAEYGDSESWAREEARRRAQQPNEPHQFEFFFEAPWRTRDPYCYSPRPDPMANETVNGNLFYRR
jgi:hypothetical protein